MKAVIFVILSGIGFAWPVAGRFFKLGAADATLAMTGGTFLCAVVGWLLNRDTVAPIPWVGIIIVGAICGILMNGIATSLYMELSSGRMGNANVLVPSVVVVMLLALVLGNWSIHGDPMDVQKSIGVVVVLVGVYLLTS